ncbi:MAG: efflux RND transporter periplasmic adaptor subunit [Candidatus Krumholzibacteriota bacterium]|nr:efflux RND transporter periplasmic adaptor subunit [Candidatus Krumholzibacteriota bacterium]
MKKPIGLCALLAAILLASCGGERPADSPVAHDDHEGGVSSTIWSDSLEVFVECGKPAPDRGTTVSVLLTRLPDFTPLREGAVTVRFAGESGSVATASTPAPVRAGIWEVSLPDLGPGEYDLAVDIAVRGRVERFDAGRVRFGGDERHETESGPGDAEKPDIEEDHDAHGDNPAHEPAGEQIVFLKEQQWNAGFGVEPVRRVEMQTTIPAVAEVTPRMNGYAEIVSPVDGLLSVAHNRGMASPGMRVAEGDPVMIVCPPPAGDGTWAGMHLGYRRAKEEFDRAGRLRERDAIAARDYEAIREAWLVKKAGYESILQGGFVVPVEAEGTKEIHLVIKAPIGGVVASVEVLPGQAVSAGRKLATVVDPSSVRLRVDLFERDYYRIDEPRGATIAVPGLDRTLLVEGDDFRLVSRGDIFDAASRTIPVVFETANPGGVLKIGQIVCIDIFTAAAASSIAVPEAAIIDEDYGTYVFVQTGGEVFEKRAVQTGARWNGLVAVSGNVEEGERIVVKGAYGVKLAATQETVGDPHAH